MKDAHRVTQYIVDFNQLASQIQDYGDGTLRRLFYSGLPDRLKDEIARVGKPLTLHGLRALCQEINALLGVQGQDLSYDKDPVHLVPNQVLQLQRQLIQLWSGEIQDQKPLQLHQLRLVQNDQQPALLWFQTGLNQQAW